MLGPEWTSKNSITVILVGRGWLTSALYHFCIDSVVDDTCILEELFEDLSSWLEGFRTSREKSFDDN